jgi:hypothetical protein
VDRRDQSVPATDVDGERGNPVGEDRAAFLRDKIDERRIARPVGVL